MKESTRTVFTKNSAGSKVTLEDFEILKVLGRGAFGKVFSLGEYIFVDTYTYNSDRSNLLF